MINLNLNQSRALHVLDAHLNGHSSDIVEEALEYEEIESVRINEQGERVVSLKRVPKTGFYSQRHY